MTLLAPLARLLCAAALAAPLAALGPSPAAHAADEAPVADVVPSSLDRGQRPQVPWLGRGGIIHVGDRTLDTRLDAGPGRPLGRFRRVTDGWVVEADGLQLVRRGHQPRELLSWTPDLWRVETGRDERRRIAVVGRNGEKVKVIGRRGAVIASRRTRDAAPVAFHRGKVWGTFAGVAGYWDLATDRVVRVGAKGAGEILAADPRHGVVARSAGVTPEDVICLRVAPVSTDAGWTAWTACPDGNVVGFSPDGSRLVVGVYDGADDGTMRELQLRETRTGEVLRRWTGRFGDYRRTPDSYSPATIRFESGGALLVDALDPMRSRGALVRLGLDGSMARAAALDGVSTPDGLGPEPVSGP